MKNNRSFRRAIITSAALHTVLFLLLIFSPSLPRPAKKGLVYYLPLNLVGPPGGGGGGGGGGSPVLTQTPASSRTSLRDLTAIQKKAAQPPEGSLRYPVDKKNRAKKTATKETIISKPQPETSAAKPETGSAGGSGGPPGSGIRIGVGPGPGGGGVGGWGGGNFDLSSFPYTYYLQIIQDRISTNWFTSLLDPGVSGQWQCVVFFKIFRDGRITDLQVESSSNLRSFDLSALRAVQNASPFPPLPKEFEGEYLGIHLIFEHVR